MSMKNELEIGKYYYTQNGLFVKLVNVLKLAGKGTQYVVVDEQDNGDSPSIDTPYIVESLFEDVAMTPTVVRRTALQEETNKLADKRNDLVKEIRSLEMKKKDFLYDIHPDFKVGQQVFTYRFYGEKPEAVTVKSIKLYITENGHETYYLNYSLDTISDPSATAEEAEQKLSKNKTIRASQQAEYDKKRYQEAKDFIEKYKATPHQLSE